MHVSATMANATANRPRSRNRKGRLPSIDPDATRANSRRQDRHRRSVNTPAAGDSRTENLVECARRMTSRPTKGIFIYLALSFGLAWIAVLPLWVAHEGLKHPMAR